MAPGKPKTPSALSLLQGKRDELVIMFTEMDDSGDGELDLDEFTEGLKRVGLKISDTEMRMLFKTADADGSGSVSVEEFDALIRDSESRVKVECLGVKRYKIYERMAAYGDLLSMDGNEKNGIYFIQYKFSHHAEEAVAQCGDVPLDGQYPKVNYCMMTEQDEAMKAEEEEEEEAERQRQEELAEVGAKPVDAQGQSVDPSKGAADGATLPEGAGEGEGGDAAPAAAGGEGGEEGAAADAAGGEAAEGGAAEADAAEGGDAADGADAGADAGAAEPAAEDPPAADPAPEGGDAAAAEGGDGGEAAAAE